MSREPGDVVAALNAHRPGIIESLGGEVAGFDPANGCLTMTFRITEQLCHSGNIVQGGIVTAMLDATMSHTLFANQPDVTMLSSLEIKVSFLEPALAGNFRCEGRLRRGSYKIAFLEGELYNDDGKLAATASTTAKLRRAGS